MKGGPHYHWNTPSLRRHLVESCQWGTLAQHNPEWRASSVYGLLIDGHADQKMQMAEYRSHMKRGRQLYCSQWNPLYQDGWWETHPRKPWYRTVEKVLEGAHRYGWNAVPHLLVNSNHNTYVPILNGREMWKKGVKRNFPASPELNPKEASRFFLLAAHRLGVFQFESRSKINQFSITFHNCFRYHVNLHKSLLF